MTAVSQKIKDKIVDHYTHGGRYFRGAFDQSGLANIEAGRQLFPFKKNISYFYYQPRTLQRYLFIADKFSSFLQGKILDVGSRDNTIQKILNKDCVLVDKNNPNLPPFDWEKEKLPFADNSFDTVVCMDTLEHIHNFHESFFDLVRVAKNHVIISLPNCWRKTLKKFLQGGSGMASYGLPPEKPLDRHKWFFHTEDVEDFMFYNTTPKNSIKIEAIYYHLPKTIWRHRLLYPILEKILPESYFKNFLVETIFICLEKLENKPAAVIESHMD